MTSVQKWTLGLLLFWSFALRLLFSWPDPTMSRWIDERYNAGNVAAILVQDQWQPVRTHYPSLSYLPHAAILKAYETARSLPVLSDSPSAFGTWRGETAHLSRLGLRVCRSIHALIGAASIWVVFLIGHRLFGPGIALAAAFLVSVSPWHLILSAMFKPDVVLVFVSLLALYAMLHAHRRETLASYAIAGALVGATAAAKWNGAALALPLLATVVLGGVRSPGLALRRAAAASASAVAVLLLLNPWLLTVPDLYRHHLRVNRDYYDMKLAQSGATWFDQPVSAIVSFLRSIYFSPVFGACAVIGLGLMLAVCLRRWRTPGHHLPAARHGATIADAFILLTFFGGYVAALWAATRYPRPPNWLIVAPIAALAGAWLIAQLLAVARKAPRPWPQRVAVGAGIVALGLAGADKVRFVSRFVYDATVPTTASEAARAAGSTKPLRGRVFFTELPVGRQDFDPRVWNSDFLPTLTLTDRLAGEPVAELAVADALLFPASRLAPNQEPFYRELTASPHAVVSEFRPTFFRLRGEGAVVVQHRFFTIEPPAAAAVAVVGDGVYEVGPPNVPTSDPSNGSGGELVSFEIAFRAPAATEVVVAVEADGRPVDCRPTQRGRQRRRCLTQRIEPPSTPVRVALTPPHDLIEVVVFRWRRPAPLVEE